MGFGEMVCSTARVWSEKIRGEAGGHTTLGSFATLAEDIYLMNVATRKLRIRQTHSNY
jgi:hypothetical protein